jgi:hypothetical protein
MSEFSARLTRGGRRAILGMVIAGLAVGCGDATGPDPVDDSIVPAGADVTAPFPIDRGDDPGTPGSYKGLFLRLADNGEPQVTPVDGVIGLVCIGMSNGNQECNEYIQQVIGSFASAIDPAVRVVNCAVGGHAIERWIDPAYDAALWDDCVSRKLAQAGVRADQVRVLWHKAADQFTTLANGAAMPTYPAPGSDYQAFLSNLSAFAARVHTKFPSVQAVYTTSRSYGGFAGTAGRGEPLSYEEGHALNAWLADHPEVDGVWYGWGPYIWAPDCGTDVENGGGICFVRDDYVSDGVHPSPSGRAKVSALLHARLLEHAWYRR